MNPIINKDQTTITKSNQKLSQTQHKELY